MGLLPLGILGTPTVGNYGYRMSKAAVVSFGHALANDLRERGIAVLIASPGRVDTPLVRQVLAEGRVSEKILESAIDIETAGRLLRDRLDELTLDQSPLFQRDPEGNPAIPESVREQLLEANSAQAAAGAQPLLDRR
jgi:NAD(P)-dependent dehydrogenase (short-subunit alcohol dehydrogenase family)